MRLVTSKCRTNGGKSFHKAKSAYPAMIQNGTNSSRIVMSNPARALRSLALLLLSTVRLVSLSDMVSGTFMLLLMEVFEESQLYYTTPRQKNKREMPKMHAKRRESLTASTTVAGKRQGKPHFPVLC